MPRKNRKDKPKVPDPYAAYRDADGVITAQVSFAKITRLAMLQTRQKYETAEELAAACQDYFDWAEHNPLLEAKLVSYQGDSVLEEVPKKRALTLSAMCTFINVHQRTWQKWRPDDNEYCNEHLTPAVLWAEAVIRGDKFEGGMAGFYNAAMVMSDLDMANKVDNKGGMTVIFDQGDSNL